MIDSPRNPYGSYPGNKREYVHEMLSNAPDLETFLRTTVPYVVVDCEIEPPSPSTQRLRFVMEKLGYQLDPEDDWAGATNSYVASASFPPELLSMSGGSKPPPGIAIEIPDLPGDVQELIDELNDNLNRDNKNAAALLTRKIIDKAVFIAMDKRGKSGLLKTKTGEDVGLGVAIAKCAQEYGLTNQAVGRVTSTKWIGDSANHSYRVKVNEGDLERAVIGLRLLLEEIL